MKCDCQCHFSDYYSHVAACCCQHQVIFGQCEDCGDEWPPVKPGYSRSTIDCLFHGGHAWYWSDGVGVGVGVCDLCGNTTGKPKS